MDMDLPELVSEDSAVNISEVESDPPILNPEVVKKTAQVIISRVEDIPDIKNSLVLEKHLPSYNVPEKIIFALDTARDENYTYFIGSENEKISPFNALLSAIKMFISLKKQLNDDTEFALATLNQYKATWEVDYTSRPNQLTERLEQILECKAEDTFDLGSLISLVSSKTRTWEFFKERSLPPPYIVRVVLLYNRSYTIPEIDLKYDYCDLLHCPFFFVDIIAAHEPISHQNNCEEIFKLLQKLDKKGYSYFFNVGRSMDLLVNSLLKILAHPLQRPPQSMADYSL